MNLKPMFLPLKDKKAVKSFILAAAIITIAYFSFSIGIALFSFRIPDANLIQIILYGFVRAFSTFKLLDWIILGLFPLAGGLLFANYSYWQCKTDKGAKVGLFAGLLAASCPACILPAIALSGAMPFFMSINLYIKLGALGLILGSTYYVAQKQSKGKCVL